MLLKEKGDISRSGANGRTPWEICARYELTGEDYGRRQRGQPNLEDSFADYCGMRWRACRAAEVHAQVAMAIVVIAVGEPVRSEHRRRRNQRDRSDERDPITAAEGFGQRAHG